jgi:uncharacterized membrane protein YeiH
VASFMGVITGVAGGIIRDMMCNEIPIVFTSTLYATVSWLGGSPQSSVLSPQSSVLSPQYFFSSSSSKPKSRRSIIRCGYKIPSR